MEKSKNKIIGLLAIAAIMLFATSCFEPLTKETYLIQFESFVKNVGDKHHDYNKNDWKYADERFQKFSSEWHDKFKNELTLKEELKVAGLIVKYQSYKSGSKLEKIYKGVFKEDVDKMKDKIKHYIDNDMDEDLEKIKEGAEQIGDSVLKVVEDIFEELDVEI